MGEYRLELKLDKPNDVRLPLFDEKGTYAKYKLENEEEIFDYFGSLTFPISIIDIYKEISSKFLGDISKYPEFSLKLSKITKSGEVKVTDFIDLSNGNFERMGMITDNDYVVCLDKNDNWRVELPACKTNPSHFTMVSDGGKIACTFNFDDNRCIRDYVNKPLSVDINVANEEIASVKKRVRVLFGYDRGSK